MLIQAQIKVILLIHIFQMVRCKSSSDIALTAASKLSLDALSKSLPDSPEKFMAEPEKRRRQINWDKHSTIVFPVVAATFNCIYWVFYLILNKN